MKKLFAITICAALCGCSAMKSSHTVSAEAVSAAHDMTLEKSSTLPNITVSGSSNVVTIAPSPQTVSLRDTSNTKGDASGESRSLFRGGITVWLAIALAIGLAAALLLAWILFSKLSASGASADKAFSDTIQAVEHGATDVLGLLHKKRAEL